jgi:Rv0078B-related antitoxin
VSDTSREAAEIQDDIHRRMTGAERLRLAIKMSIAARELTLARLRAEHPDWSEWELKRELLRYAFGSDPLPEVLR